MVARGLAVLFAIATLALGAFLAYDRLGPDGGSSQGPWPLWQALPLETKYEICGQALRSYLDVGYKVYPESYYFWCGLCGPGKTRLLADQPAGGLSQNWTCVVR